ncbi:MAG: type II toxin-antitoxin system Phd/YefM family antitoxin [Pseudonocardiaceae bacterium]
MSGIECYSTRCHSDEVARSHSTIVVTKHGKPVAKLVPIDDKSVPTRGSVTLLVEDDEAYFSTGQTWHADR